MGEMKLTRNFVSTADGSVLIELGMTRVICTASLEDRVPPFLKDQGRGWVTAEYAMLPRATQTRKMRESPASRNCADFTKKSCIRKTARRPLSGISDSLALKCPHYWRMHR